MADLQRSIEDLWAARAELPSDDADARALVLEAIDLLDTGKARDTLGFVPPWGARDVVRKTAEWYRAYYEDARSAMDVTLAQIADYRRAIGDGGV